MEKDNILRAIELSLLDKADNKKLYEDVQKIIHFVEDVQSINTSAACSSGERFAKVNIFREDKVTEEPGKYREEVLSQAPARFKNWLISRKIL